MSLIKLLKTVFKRERASMFLFLLTTFLLALFYRLRFGVDEFAYTLEISGFIFAVYFLYKVYEYKKFYQELQACRHGKSVRENLDDGYKDAFNMINTIHEEHTERFYSLQNKLQERDRLLEQWIHNMKTSVTVINLACDKGNREIGAMDFLADIAEENGKLETNLEETLNLFRLDDFSRDYVPETVSLKELVGSTINSIKREFVYKRVFPKVEIPEEFLVKTDKKWGAYMLGQIISNAIKYSDKEQGSVVFKAFPREEKIVLSIEDNGMGICREDLPRIFEAFFTGSNGRKGQNSSGVGLYMVKLVAEELGHSIEVKSEPLKGTTFEVSFSI